MTAFIELLAILTTAIYGVLLARQQKMDFVGVFSIALIVSFGGGTLRDILIDRHPIFWIEHWHYSVIVFTIALVTSFIRKIPGRIEKWLPLPDALGLGLYSLLGTKFALESGDVFWFVAVLLGVVTGTFGGVIGDVICNRIPSLFRPDSRLYASCSFAGCLAFLGLRNIGVSENIALWTGVALIVLFRLAALHWNIRLPGHGDPDEPAES